MKAVAPLVGRVLDTTTGLGYTAIEASKTASEVITVELDPAVLEIARLNPWSRALFDSPNITQLVGDSAEVVHEFHDGYFTRVIHDPPTFSLAGELYSQAFYRQLYRVLKRGGRLFHYIGDLDSKLGSRVMKGAVRRLQDAGFQTVRRVPAAFGLAAYK
jgi:predicted methyltransferase